MLVELLGVKGRLIGFESYETSYHSEKSKCRKYIAKVLNKDGVLFMLENVNEEVIQDMFSDIKYNPPYHELMEFYKDVISLPNCHNCSLTHNCDSKPTSGVRYNCPLHIAEKPNKTNSI